MRHRIPKNPNLNGQKVISKTNLTLICVNEISELVANNCNYLIMIIINASAKAFRCSRIDLFALEELARSGAQRIRRLFPNNWKQEKVNFI